MSLSYIYRPLFLPSNMDFECGLVLKMKDMNMHFTEGLYYHLYDDRSTKTFV
jgi:hypothetical protein